MSKEKFILDTFLSKFYVMDLPNEEWRDIPNYEGVYQVSNPCRVKSMVREIEMSNQSLGLFYERIMKQRLQKMGYWVTELCKNGVREHWLVHRIVALAFVTNPNGYEVVNHLDGIKINNLPCNLQWCTSSQNQEHAYNLGLRKSMVGNKYNAKLNKGNIEIIRKRLDKGEYMSIIAEDFNVSTGAIFKIKHNQSWVDTLRIVKP